MLILILKSQQFLFDAPIHVGAHVRKDGTVVKPHTRIQKVALHQPAAHQLGLFGDAKPEPQKKRTKLQAFIDKQGGRDALAGKLRQLTEEQQQVLFEKMAALDGGDVAAVRAMFSDAKPQEPDQPDLFGQKGDNDYLERARSLYREYVENGIGNAPPQQAALFERRVRLFSESLPPGESEAKEVLGRMFSGRYGNNPPEPPKMSDEAKARLQGAVARKTRETLPNDESDQGKADREWRENYDRIVNLSSDELIRESTKDLERASAYGDKRLSSEKRKGWDGGSVNQSMIDALQANQDFIDAELKRRREKRESQASKAGPAKFGNESPREGERNADGLVFRHGRWHRDDEPAENGAEFNGLVHGTARPFAAFDESRAGKNGGGFNHQGKGIYLTDDPDGLGRFFAQTAADRVSFDEHYRKKLISRDEADALEASGGVLLDVKIHPNAKILDLRKPGADKDLLQLVNSVGTNPEAGNALSERVRAMGYDGVAFEEPNRPEGWETKDNATTVVVYNYDKVSIAGSRQAAAKKRDPSAPFGVAAGTSKGRRREINAEVVARLERGGPYTEADLALMRQYSGNGGCGDSLNEFYTDPAVAQAQWSAIRRLGISGGTALEPSCATGVFLHTAPEGFRVTGVEMDPISSACAQALHSDRHEIHGGVSFERFARSDGGRQFDAVIGNPPYGPRGSLAKDDKPELKTAEAYFIDTAIDKARAGGIVSLVIPASVMNNKNGRAFRERILRKAEFLGAQRMPNTAFEASHTDVTADVIWLRKRPDDVAGALMTLDKKDLKSLGVWDDEFLSGTYFQGRGAGNVFGAEGTAMRAYGEVYTVTGSMSGVPEAIAGFEPHPVGATPGVHEIIAALGDNDAAIKRAMGGAMVRPYADAKEGDTKIVDGVTYVLQGKPLRWHRVDEILQQDAVVEAKPIAEQIEALMTGSSAVNRQALEDAVNAWVSRHGIPAKSKHLTDAAEHDKVLHRLIGAVDHSGRVSDAVAGRVERRIESSLDLAAATLAAESADRSFTEAELSERSGRPVDEIADILVANPSFAYVGPGRWATMEDYLTGELWPKLDAMRAGGHPAELQEKVAYQARRLEETIAPKSLEDVEIALNSGFIPPEIIAAWLSSRVQAYKDANPKSDYAHKLSTDAKVVFSDSVYSVSGGMWGDADLIAKYLNRTGVRKDDMPRVEQFNTEFRDWLLTSDYRDTIEDLYNRKFRGFVEPKWSNEPISIPGLDGARLKPYHWSSLRWALSVGKGIIADDVGLGKTVRGLMLARLAKMTGKASKPTFVVPKSVLANWVAESEAWFPGSRVLVIGETYSRDKDGNLKSRPDTEVERNRKYHDLTQNNYDFVFISQPAYNELDVDPVTKGDYLDQDFWVQRGDRLGNAGDKKVKRVREEYKQAVANREFEKRTDAIYFNKLGIDMLIIDEAHAYKNLYAARARFGENPKFLGGQGQSNRAFDMSFKAKWLREQNGGGGIYALTATPTKNSPLEVYSMLSYIAPEAFEAIGIRNSEEFLDRYCVFKNENTLGTDGSISEQLVTAGFKNLDELRGIMSKFIMRRTAEDVGLKLPEASQEMHLVDMTPEQQKVYGELRALLAESGKKDATGDAHIFSIMTKMAKAALDLELLDPKAHKGQPSPKYDEAAKQISSRVKDGGQVVFCESVDSHEKIADALVRAGVPRDRIAIMNAQSASSSAARQNISDKFNSGKLDVVIGNKVMEEGVNLQKRTSDIHHLDTPWDPATLQQRNGRGVRQGNVNESIRLHTYLARGSFDGYRYQSMRAKRDWAEMLWNGGDRVDNLAREGVFSREDMMIMMSADPDEARAKLAADKEAAMQRLNAERTAEASQEFVRFQSLKRSFRQVKNKETASARRLLSQIEAAKTRLMSNKHFKAKSALDSNDDVLINPASGEILTKDIGLECTESDGTAIKWVVTGVDPLKNTVSMRMYADTTGHSGVTVPASKLADGVKVFDFNPSHEADEVGKKLEADANAKLNNLKDWGDVAKMPESVIAGNYDLIQRQIKEGRANYSGFTSLPYRTGQREMLNRATGKVELVSEYDTKKHHDTHDYVLPIEAHKKAVIEAWKESRRRSSVGEKYVESGRRRRGSYGGSGNQTRKAARQYDDVTVGDKSINPLSAAIKDLGTKYGGSLASPLEKQAKAEFEKEQLQRVKRASSFKEALEHAIAAGSVVSGDGSSEDRLMIPRPILATLWAKAKRAGVLGDVADGHLEKSKYGGLKHSRYAYAKSETESVQTMLEQMALNSRARDLALAMAEAANKGGVNRDQKEAYHSMHKIGFSSLGAGEHALKARAYRLAMRHAEAGGFIDQSKDTVHKTGSYWGGYNPRETLRSYLEDQAKANELRANSGQQEAA